MKISQFKVLVVEDDAALLNILCEKLEKEGYEVFRAVDGQEAIDITLNESPGLILLDLLLPKVDGFKVLETIRKYPEKKIAATSVVIFSNLWSNKDILRIKALTVDEYFVKASTSMEQVLSKIKEIAKAKK